MTAGHSNSIDSTHDLLRGRRGPMDVFVRPQCVALVGATDRRGSVGCRLAENLLRSSPKQEVVFVNPTRPSLLGRKCYSQLADAPLQIDLAVVAVPAPHVPSVIEQCLAAKVRGAIVVSAGFKEIGAAGVALEATIRSLIAGTPLRVIGPNCLGVMSPIERLERQLRGRHGTARQPGFHYPKRRAADGHSRLEPGGARRFQPRVFRRLDARRRLGRSYRFLRQRSPHQQHPDVHGVDRQRPFVPFRGA